MEIERDKHIWSIGIVTDIEMEMSIRRGIAMEVDVGRDGDRDAEKDVDRMGTETVVVIYVIQGGRWRWR